MSMRYQSARNIIWKNSGMCIKCCNPHYIFLQSISWIEILRHRYQKTNRLEKLIISMQHNSMSHCISLVLPVEAMSVHRTKYTYMRQHDLLLNIKYSTHYCKYENHFYLTVLLARLLQNNMKYLTTQLLLLKVTCIVLRMRSSLSYQMILLLLLLAVFYSV